MLLIHWAKHLKAEAAALDCLQRQFTSTAVFCNGSVVWTGIPLPLGDKRSDLMRCSQDQLKCSTSALPFLMMRSSDCFRNECWQQLGASELPEHQLAPPIFMFSSHWQPGTFDSSFPHLNPFVVWPLQHVVTVASPVCALCSPVCKFFPFH